MLPVLHHRGMVGKEEWYAREHPAIIYAKLQLTVVGPFYITHEPGISSSRKEKVKKKNM
jgi:hypothetical protein